MHRRGRRSPDHRRPGDPDRLSDIEVAAGEAVTLALRPEMVIRWASGDRGDARTGCPATVEDINFLGSIVRIRLRLGDGADGEPPALIALDTFNEPHLALPPVGADGDRLVPARGVPGPCRVGAPSRSRRRLAAARRASGRRGVRPTASTGIDLVVFDKDGTLIEFHAMWSGWAEDLAGRLRTATGRDLRDDLFAMLGYDPVAGRAVAGGRLAATPMARLRDLTGAMLRDHGLDREAAGAALDAAWHAPDPVALARPRDGPAGPARDRAGGRAAASRWPRPTIATRRCARSRRSGSRPSSTTWSAPTTGSPRSPHPTWSAMSASASGWRPSGPS